MSTPRAEIDLFMRKCDEASSGGFILADTKIGELLQSIVTSDVLYALFRRILRGFDYDATGRACMGAAGANKKLLFPEDPVQKLAFIFCLLVDLDNKRIDLSAFLQEFFYEDGSLYESYYAFCNQIIKPLRSGIRALLAEEPAGSSVPAPAFSAKTVETERDDVVRSGMPDALKVDALLLLNQISVCVRAGGEPLAAALCGYLYFCAGCGRKNERIDAMREVFGSVKEAL